MPIRVGKGNIYILLILKGGKPMNKKKKLLTVVTLVILMLEASVFTVSAADNYSVDENTTYVTNFAELEKALEATSNETTPTR